MALNGIGWKERKKKTCRHDDNVAESFGRFHIWKISLFPSKWTWKRTARQMALAVNRHKMKNGGPSQSATSSLLLLTGFLEGKWAPGAYLHTPTHTHTHTHTRRCSASAVARSPNNKKIVGKFVFFLKKKENGENFPSIYFCFLREKEKQRNQTGNARSCQKKIGMNAICGRNEELRIAYRLIITRSTVKSVTKVDRWGEFSFFETNGDDGCGCFGGKRNERPTPSVDEMRNYVLRTV